MKSIYLDNAATTPLDVQVFSTMKPYFQKEYGNASEFHILGRDARLAIEQAREKICHFLGGKSQEIFFTSCATEAINLAHKGLIEALRRNFKEKPHVITTAIEHKAVLESLDHLEREGAVEITVLPVDKWGRITLKSLKDSILPNTVLVSVMYVNNEVGTIEPIASIGRFIRMTNKGRKRRIYFHTDATQAIQYLNTKVNYLGVDLLSLTGHKIYAPKGIGVLYVREGTPLVRQMDGGSQESGMRSGTENTPSIVALGKAVDLVSICRVSESSRVKQLRDKLISELLKIPEVSLTGHPKVRAPHIASFVVKNVEGEAVVLLLSASRIFISSGSACTSSSLTASHVLTAMGFPEELSHGSVRFSLGRYTKEKDINFVVAKFTKVVQRLRKMSPE